MKKMKKSILTLKSVQELGKSEQKNIVGSGVVRYCCEYGPRGNCTVWGNTQTGCP